MMRRLPRLPKVPFVPESLDALKARLPAALAVVVDLESVTLGVAPRAGESRAHCFDWSDGLRLIISRDRLRDGAIVRHVSAGVLPGSEIYRQDRAGQLSGPGFIALAQERYTLLTGEPALPLVTISPMGVAHFASPEPE